MRGMCLHACQENDGHFRRVGSDRLEQIQALLPLGKPGACFRQGAGKDQVVTMLVETIVGFLTVRSHCGTNRLLSQYLQQRPCGCLILVNNQDIAIDHSAG